MASLHTDVPSSSAAIRARLNHPIIDSDGHQVEMVPVFLDYLAEVGGASVAKRFKDGVAFDSFLNFEWRDLKPEERRERCAMKPVWWAGPTRNTRDLATSFFPKLFHERMEEMGLDVSVVYPTLGLLTVLIGDEEVRRAACRALNRMKADMFAGFTDRLIPVATIPMHTPREAIDELEFAVRDLKLRAVMMASLVPRAIKEAMRISPQAARYSYWIDTFGLDSEYDYDPVWAKCVELGVSPTFHSLGYGWGSRTSTTNYIHNHLGSFASSADAVCRGLFMGGVPKRFPQLKFAFLEGGVAWARSLYCDLVSHWEKRNREALENYNPAHINTAEFTELAARYGGRHVAGRVETLIADHRDRMARGEDAASFDEWAPSGIGSAEEICEIFTQRFYFGCEGDDPLNALAFDTKGSPFHAKLHALYGSDLGHWDVPEMAQAAQEAHELVEHGVISEDAFRDMVFTNAVEFWTSGNRNFFSGTSVQAAVNSLLANGGPKQQ
jgi:predicted TIM-barrel fold metal-dependent hydrolase